jgi:hypothetical protein
MSPIRIESVQAKATKTNDSATFACLNTGISPDMR